MDKEINQRFINVKNSKTFNRIIRLLGLNNKKVFDVGCGFGEYLALFGKGSFGITSTEEEVFVARERGLDVFKTNAELISRDSIKNDFGVIWANNLFEHLLSPHYFLMRLRSISDNGAILVLGVPVIPKFVSLLRLSHFGGSLASNHINFFTKETLRLTVERSGWRVIEARPYLSKFRIFDSILSFFSPHIYIIAKKDPLFNYPEKKVLEWEGESYYENILGMTK
ncbi:MAG: Methyltransferase type 11 [Parcubacteria group bacterium GW2011_GWF2_38_76]|nr:MAG: Methyltransferase type 11 [Parcubacteria group bacterium GW2011_GWF2_38_76]HBM45766.1 hypothetical protein [Patescibacteria group bacterium]